MTTVTNGTTGNNLAVIVIHGGAAKVYKEETVKAKIAGVTAAARAGYKLLSEGKSAVEAVEAAVRVMEDDLTFNAGTGASLTSEGLVELDAMMMEGKWMNVGGITSVTRIRNPISVARAVMEQSEHCLFAGQGGHDFASSAGFELIDQKALISPQAQARLVQFKTFNNAVTDVMSQDERDVTKEQDHDTVGAVALDLHGDLAAATSTGGITGKLPGRVGDSPLPGSGAWAENSTAAISTTGHGEAIMRVNLARMAASGPHSGPGSLVKNSKHALDFMVTRVDGSGGLVGVNATGEVAAEFTTEDMAWAYIKLHEPDGLVHFGVRKGQHFTEKI